MAPGARPKLTAQTVVGRVTEIREQLGLSKSAFGNKLGKSGYQLVRNWEAGKKKPGLRSLKRAAAVGGYKLDDLLSGTIDGDQIVALDQSAGMGEPPADEPMGRGDALVWVDDQSGISDAAKERIRASLRRHPDRKWTREDLLILAEVIDGPVAVVSPRLEQRAERDLAAAGGEPIDQKTRPSSMPPPRKRSKG